jgi:hypothetical protein
MGKENKQCRYFSSHLDMRSLSEKALKKLLSALIDLKLALIALQNFVK